MQTTLAPHPGLEPVASSMARLAGQLKEDELQHGSPGWHLFYCIGALANADRETLEWHREAIQGDLPEGAPLRNEMVGQIDRALATLGT